jgi:hypothetical protein
MCEDEAPCGQVFLDPVLIERMQILVDHRTRESLNDRFGISYNTWRKLIAGNPIRMSLAMRLQERIRRIEADE